MQFILSPYARAIVLMIGDRGEKSFMDRKRKISAFTAYTAQTRAQGRASAPRNAPLRARVRAGRHAATDR